MGHNRKVAIMTWYNYRNYGSILQADAIGYTINKLGYTPEFIQYTHNPIVEIKEITFITLVQKIKNKLKAKSNKKYTSKEQEQLFLDYINSHVTETDLCKTHAELRDLSEHYDAFICGSDQIWSPLCYDPKYFFPFVDNPKKLIAYAPSFGATEIKNDIIRGHIAAQISRFEHLSVRELQGAKIIKELTGQEAAVVLDPTLLLSSAEWDTHIDTHKIKKIPDKKYILCYFLGDSTKYMGYVHSLSKEMSIPFYVIPITEKQKNSVYSVPFEVGPREFVSLIRNATYVCTDSFHGTAFAINYNIPFSAFKRFKDSDTQDQNSRLFSILHLLKLENRLTDYNKRKNLDHTLNCDFSQANRLLSEHRKKSIQYLKNSLYHSVLSENKTSILKITDTCCGCGACASVCKKNAVSVVKNEEGFFHYTLDEKKCVDCGLCKAVCPMTGITASDIKNSQALYSWKSNSPKVLRTSSSGGIGHELASYCANKGYFVCGCAYDSTTNSARHIWISPKEADRLSLLQGSKYIQSNTSDAFARLVDLAKHGPVAFFGTPCQAAAADRLLRKNNLRENAIVVDLICHGVPSYYLWKKHLCDVHKKYNTGHHPSVLFRSKQYGWKKRSLQIEGNGVLYKKPEDKDDFYAFFRRRLCDMKSCSDCPYREKSCADLRIGDYWGKRFSNDQQGVSMVIANTVLGEKTVELLNKHHRGQAVRHKLQEYWTVQYPYNSPMPLIREQLIVDLKSGKTSLHALRKQYCKHYDRSEKLNKIREAIKRVLRRDRSGEQA